MTNRNHKKSKKKSPKPAQEKGNGIPAQSDRSISRDIFWGLLVTIWFFCVIELSLRVGGVATPNPVEDPFAGFAGLRPLFTVSDGIARTSEAKRKYFNDIGFSVSKSPGKMRVFCFGGSTTYGHPFDQRTAFSRMMQDFLGQADPSKSFEVINAGGISYASYRILPLMEEALKYSPDLMVVYTGHNEFLESRTYADEAGRDPALRRVMAFLEDVRIYRLLRRVFIGVGLVPSRKDGDKAVLKEEVDALLDRSAGPGMYHRDEVFARQVADHFESNLRRMVELCRRAHTSMVLVRPVSNLKDFSPFKSESSSESAQARATYERDLAQAVGLIETNAAESAVSLLTDLSARDPQYAETRYHLGRALLKSGRFPEAAKEFNAAKDLDVCPLRMTTALEDRLLRVARDTHTPLVPFREAVERNASETGDKSGIPGDEQFLDHVHPTPEMHGLLALQLVEETAALGLVKISRPLTPADAAAHVKSVVSGLDPLYIAERDLNLAKTLRWAGKKTEARAALAKAAQMFPDRAEIHKMLGAYLLEDGAHEAGIAEYSRALQLSGNDPEMRYSLATAYARAGRSQEALDHYLAVTNSETRYADAYANAAMLYLGRGETAKAQVLLEKGLSAGIETGAVSAAYALVNAVENRPDQALTWMRKAVAAEPGEPSHYYNLAGIYVMLSRPDEAMDALMTAVKKGYRDAAKLNRDPVFDRIKQRPDFRELLQKIQ